MQSSITIGQACEQAQLLLEGAGIASARIDATILMGHILDLPREKLLLSSDEVIDNHQLSEFLGLAARRQHHEPIAYITGKKEFWSLDFYVTRDTLIPRPDSETLVEAALKRVRDRKLTKRERTEDQAKPIALLDIGTGTGCLLIALLKEIPEAQGIGVDNSKRALLVAEANAKKHGIKDRVTFIESNWCDALNGTFDLIISNPPYIDASAMSSLMPDIAHFEPHSALVAGKDGLDAYRALAPQVAAKLNPNGYALLEVGYGQADAVAGLLKTQGLTLEEYEKDLAGIARCVIARKYA